MCIFLKYLLYIFIYSLYYYSMSGNDFNKIAKEAVKKGAILSNLFFDSKEDSEEVVKKQLTLLFKKISKEQGVIYGAGIIEPPIKEDYPDGAKYLSSGEIKVLTQDLNSLIRLVGMYGPVHIEIEKPEKMKVKPPEFEKILNQSIFITYKLSQHIVRSTLKEEIQKKFYFKNNFYRDKIISLVEDKNYPIENCFESREILDDYYEKGKYISTFSFNIHDFKEEEIEKKFEELLKTIKTIKTISDVKELKETEFDEVDEINKEVKYYSKVKHLVIVCDDISTLFILAFRLGAAYVKLNVQDNITINFMEFQDPINELSQVVFELSDYIIKNKLMEDIK
jgi:hypothetical protein